jgi:SAM-dependent methyltransferase
MAIGEWILGVLSREPAPGAAAHGSVTYAPGKELALLRREYPGLAALVRGKRVVDFGCGNGDQAIALAREEGCEVLGIDSNPVTLELAREKAASQALANPVRFAGQVTPELAGKFDVVISQNAMEHFPDPDHIVQLMKQLIHDDGVLLITFGPPWYAPYGSHMQYFCKVPWLNLLCSERTVMRVRSRYRSDGATRYVDVESGLNQMSLAKFERVVARAGLEVRHWHLTCVKGLNVLAAVPVLRELFVNHVSCVLAPRKGVTQN